MPIAVRDSGNQRHLIDPFDDAGLGAVEFLKALAVFFGELDREFEVRAMDARVSVDLAAADAEDAFQFRSVLKKERKASAAPCIQQRTFHHQRRSASYTFHTVNISIRKVCDYSIGGLPRLFVDRTKEERKEEE